MIVIFIYGIPDEVEDGKILKLQSMLGGILQGTQKFELGLNDVLCYTSRERTKVGRGGDVLIKVEGLQKWALKKGVDTWEIIAIQIALEEKTKEFTAGSRVRCLID